MKNQINLGRMEYWMDYVINNPQLLTSYEKYQQEVQLAFSQCLQMAKVSQRNTTTLESFINTVRSIERKRLIVAVAIVLFTIGSMAFDVSQTAVLLLLTLSAIYAVLFLSRSGNTWESARQSGQGDITIKNVKQEQQAEYNRPQPVEQDRHDSSVVRIFKPKEDVHAIHQQSQTNSMPVRTQTMVQSHAGNQAQAQPPIRQQKRTRVKQPKANATQLQSPINNEECLDIDLHIDCGVPVDKQRVEHKGNHQQPAATNQGTFKIKQPIAATASVA